MRTGNPGRYLVLYDEDNAGRVSRENSKRIDIFTLWLGYFLPAGAAGQPFFWLFTLAQRLRCASAMALRALALSFRRGFLWVTVAAAGFLRTRRRCRSLRGWRAPGAASRSLHRWRSVFGRSRLFLSLQGQNNRLVGTIVRGADCQVVSRASSSRYRDRICRIERTQGGCLRPVHGSLSADRPCRFCMAGKLECIFDTIIVTLEVLPERHQLG